MSRQRNVYFTHFLGIVLGKDLSSRGAFEEFQNLLVEDFAPKDFEKDMLIYPGRFHTTIKCLSLPNEEDIEKVKKIMNTSIKEYISENFSKGDFVEVDRLENSEGILTDARTLRLMIKRNENLLKFNSYLNKVLDEESLDYSPRNPKFHCTVMNKNFFRKRNSGVESDVKINLTGILKKYGDLRGTKWIGKRIPLISFDLMVMGSKEIDKPYEETHSVPFHE